MDLGAQDQLGERSGHEYERGAERVEELGVSDGGAPIPSVLLLVQMKVEGRVRTAPQSMNIDARRVGILEKPEHSENDDEAECGSSVLSVDCSNRIDKVVVELMPTYRDQLLYQQPVHELGRVLMQLTMMSHLVRRVEDALAEDEVSVDEHQRAGSAFWRRLTATKALLRS